MSNCDNYKSPSALGLTICTGDVSCYTGSILSCIELPANPTLNDIISATDTKICELVTLINASAGAPTPDGWILYQFADFISYTAVPYTPFSDGVTIPALSNTAWIAIKVVDANTVLIKGDLRFTATFDRTAPNWIGGGIQMDITLPPLSASNHFAGSKGLVTNFTISSNEYMGAAQVYTQNAIINSPIIDKPAARTRFYNTGGNSVVSIRSTPEWVDGTFSITYGFDGSSEIETV